MTNEIPEGSQLKLHYHNTVLIRLTDDRQTIYQRAFREILEGRDPLPIINESTEDCLGCLNMISQISKATKGSKQHKSQETKSNEHPKEWMKKRAIQKGQHLRCQ